MKIVLIYLLIVGTGVATYYFGRHVRSRREHFRDVMDTLDARHREEKKELEGLIQYWAGLSHDIDRITDQRVEEKVVREERRRHAEAASREIDEKQ